MAAFVLDTKRLVSGCNFNMKINCMYVQKLLGEEDAFSENNHTLYQIREFTLFLFIWKKVFQPFPCVPFS